MKYLDLILIIIILTNCHQSKKLITSSNFIEKTRIAIYKKDYEVLKEYSTDKWSKRISHFSNSEMIESLSILLNAKDTMSYPKRNKDELFVRGITPDIYEITEEKGKVRRIIIKPRKVTRWIQLSSFGGPNVYTKLDILTVKKIQEKLKKENWYSGEIDGVYNDQTSIAFKFYNVMVLNDRDEEYSTIMYPKLYVRKRTLESLGINWKN